MKDPLSTADALFAKSNPRAALQVLRRAATKDRPPFTVRLRLAEIYRAWGYPDEAGRWGIVIDGWTTPRERDRLARSLAARPIPADFRRAHLAVPWDIEEPNELREVVDVLVPAYVERRREAFRARWKRPHAAVRTRELAVRFYFMCAVVVMIAVVIAFVWSLIGDGAPASLWARALGTLSLAQLAVGLFISGVARALERLPWQALTFALAGLSVLGLAVLCVTAGSLPVPP